MAGFEIENGKGVSRSAGVNEDNLLETISVSIPEIAFESEVNEKAYSFCTNFVTPNTISAEAAICFMKNTGETDFSIEDIDITADASATFRVYGNVGSITNAISATANNLKLESGKTFQGTFETGGGGSSISSANILLGAYHLNNDTFDIPLHGALILSKNNDIAITVQITASGTAACVNINGFQTPIL